MPSPMVVLQFQSTPCISTQDYDHHPSMMYGALMRSIGSGVWGINCANPGRMPRAVLYDPFRVYLCFTLWTIEVVERHRNYKTLNSTHTDPHRAINILFAIKNSFIGHCKTFYYFKFWWLIYNFRQRIHRLCTLKWSWIHMNNSAF